MSRAGVIPYSACVPNLDLPSKNPNVLLCPRLQSCSSILAFTVQPGATKSVQGESQLKQVRGNKAVSTEHVKSSGHCPPKATTAAYLSDQVSVQASWRQGTQFNFQNVKTRAAEGVRYKQQSHDHDITLMTLPLRKMYTDLEWGQ